jgi:hypothetical protein
MHSSYIAQRTSQVDQVLVLTVAMPLCCQYICIVYFYHTLLYMRIMLRLSLCAVRVAQSV